MAENNQNAESAMLEALERDFQQVLVEMTGDQSIERFRKQFQKLYDSLKQSHENERLLLQKSKELKTQISKSQGMIKSAIGLNQNDSTKINILVAELANSGNLLNQMKEKEDKNKATIEHLKSLNENLETLIQQTENAQSGNTTKIQALIGAVTHLKKTCTDMEKEVEDFNDEKFNLVTEQKQIRNRMLNLESEIKKEESLKKDTLARLEKDQNRAKDHEREKKKIRAEIEEIKIERDTEIKENKKLNLMLKEMKDEDIDLKAEIEKIKEEKQESEKASEKLRNLILEFKNQNKELLIKREDKDNEIKKKSGDTNDQKIKLDQKIKAKNKKVAEIQRGLNEREGLIKNHVPTLLLMFRWYTRTRLPSSKGRQTRASDRQFKTEK